MGNAASCHLACVVLALALATGSEAAQPAPPSKTERVGPCQAFEQNPGGSWIPNREVIANDQQARGAETNFQEAAREMGKDPSLELDPHCVK